MASFEIESEIRQENRIFGPFTTRQVIVFGIAAVLGALFYLFVRPPIDAMIPVCFILGGLAWYLGFHKKNGVYAEFYLRKKIKTYIFGNISRKYRTKNRYITMLNAAYAAEKDADMQDKRKRRIYMKAQKKKAKKKSRLTGYQ